jgi:hypothetical protein
MPLDRRQCSSSRGDSCRIGSGGGLGGRNRESGLCQCSCLCICSGGRGRRRGLAFAASRTRAAGRFEKHRRIGRIGGSGHVTGIRIAHQGVHVGGRGQRAPNHSANFHAIVAIVIVASIRIGRRHCVARRDPFRWRRRDSRGENRSAILRRSSFLDHCCQRAGHHHRRARARRVLRTHRGTRKRNFPSFVSIIIIIINPCTFQISHYSGQTDRTQCRRPRA